MPCNLAPSQVEWIASLSPSQRRRFDALRPPAWSYADLGVGWNANYRDFPFTLAFLLDAALGGATSDPIIAAEIDRILGPAQLGPTPELPNTYGGLLDGRD